MNDLIGIGKINREKLNKIGIENKEDLTKIGSIEAFKQIREKVDSEAWIRTLYAFEGAINGVKSADLSRVKKDELKAIFREIDK